MMNKIKTSNRVILKYLTVFPIVFFVGIIFAISQDKIDDSLVKVINISKQGDTVIGTSDFAVVDMPKDNRFNYQADEMTSFGTSFVRMKGNVRLESADKKIRVNADNILFSKEEEKLYAFTDDYIPSVYPLDEKKLKRIASGYGMRIHPILKERKMHNGVDFSAPRGTEIYATANGTVRMAEFDKGYGNHVIIDHGSGFSTNYCQMEEFIVEQGQSVKKGELIGYVGSSGLSTAPHLHYEVMKDGEYVDPADYLGEE